MCKYYWCSLGVSLTSWHHMHTTHANLSDKFCIQRSMMNIIWWKFSIIISMLYPCTNTFCFHFFCIGYTICSSVCGQFHIELLWNKLWMFLHCRHFFWFWVYFLHVIPWHEYFLFYRWWLFGWGEEIKKQHQQIWGLNVPLQWIWLPAEVLTWWSGTHQTEDFLWNILCLSLPRWLGRAYVQPVRSGRRQKDEAFSKPTADWNRWNIYSSLSEVKLRGPDVYKCIHH